MGLLVGTYCDTKTAMLMLAINFFIDNKPLSFLPNSMPPREVLVNTVECIYQRIINHINVEKQKVKVNEEGISETVRV